MLKKKKKKLIYANIPTTKAEIIKSEMHVEKSYRSSKQKKRLYMGDDEERIITRILL